MSCMKIYPNKTVSTSHDSYLRMQVNTSDECCGRCTADARRCIAWKWTQLQDLEVRKKDTGSSSQDFDDWTNCELYQGDLQDWQNVSDGRPMMTGLNLLADAFGTKPALALWGVPILILDKVSTAGSLAAVWLVPRDSLKADVLISVSPGVRRPVWSDADKPARTHWTGR